MRSVTPLPATLSGTIIQRLIEIDEALIPYVSGALVWLCDKEPFEETGALTIEDAKILFSDMLQTYFEEMYMKTPAGATMIWHTNAPPTHWFLCTGGVVLKAEYPELYAVLGDKYGSTSTQFGLPDMQDVSPMGVGGIVALDGLAGAQFHTLITNEIPEHAHTILLRGSGTAGGALNRVNAPAQTTLASNVVTDVQGGGAQHNNLHPVFGVNFIIFGGRPA